MGRLRYRILIASRWNKEIQCEIRHMNGKKEPQERVKERARHE